MECDECQQIPVEHYNSEDLKIQSYSLSIGPDNDKNSLDFLWDTITLNENLFICSCEDLNSKKRQLLFEYFEDRTLTAKTSKDDNYILNLDEDLYL
jgi:hypothetical protein